MRTDTHGLEMKGLQKAAAATKDFGLWSPDYVEIIYDRESGEVIARKMHSPGCAAHVVPAAGQVWCGCVQRKLTMQQVADLVAGACGVRSE